jgi:hypothetical protein
MALMYGCTRRGEGQMDSSLQHNIYIYSEGYIYIYIVGYIYIYI